jgi:hypothetical protein
VQNNILIDLLPRSISIKGVDVPINSDFRTSILFELLMQDASIKAEEKIFNAIDLYFNELPKNIASKADLEVVTNAMLEFYANTEIKPTSEKNISATRHKKIYCFNQDADYIYSAFLSQYGVDLQDIEYMHWWKFKAMFKALKSDNEIVKIMEYRSIEITNDMSKQQKKFYRKMKQVYALKDNRTEVEKEKMVADTLSSLF